ncbi:MAG TPA: response regulator [Kofleriaceae bacterium]|nr:response regulator [Kofleriaceae bacterium]
MGAPRRVLLVDDHDDARELLRELCILRGHTVAEAQDGPSGIETALAFRPDVAFVDIKLPHLDGFDVARALRERMGSSCPKLVALSGFGSSHALERALAAGFDEYVVKPIDARRLEVLIIGA